jgi:cellulose synthase/poly-beta-1,6-N-acetylglucosamine synthase-like glycosyltransferase
MSTDIAASGIPATVGATRPARGGVAAGDPDHPVLDVVIPVYNEEADLAPCVRRLHA